MRASSRKRGEAWGKSSAVNSGQASPAKCGEVKSAVKSSRLKCTDAEDDEDEPDVSASQEEREHAALVA